MNAKELIKELQKRDPEKPVYFRDGRKCKAITMVTDSPHTNGLFVELTNEECNLKCSKR